MTGCWRPSTAFDLISHLPPQARGFITDHHQFIDQHFETTDLENVITIHLAFPPQTRI